MKRLPILLAAVLIGCSAATAQKVKRTSANNYLSYGELDNAKEAIDAATVHEDTKADAKTWLYRAKIYHALYETKEPKYKALSATPLDEAFEAYKKVIELDTKGDLVEEIWRYLDILGKQQVNVGIEAYNAKRYDVAAKAFKSTVDITAYDKIKRVDSLAIFYTAVCADQMNDLDLSQKMYRRSIEIGFEKERSYVNLERSLIKSGKEDEAIKVIQEGKKAVPSSQTLITDEVNIHLKKDNHAQAMKSLEDAIKLDPTNHTLYFALGFVNDRLSASEVEKNPKGSELYKTYQSSAEINYKKSIELKGDNFDALYNLGALYFNRGVKMIDIANTIDDTKKFDAAKADAEKVFEMALPYLEKAYAINGTDKGVLISLKQIYYRKMGDNPSYKAKYDEVVGKLK